MKKLWDKKFIFGEVSRPDHKRLGIHANDTPRRALPMLSDKIQQGFSFLDNGIKT